MREARIICPCPGGMAPPLSIRALESALIGAFHGFTMYFGQGAGLDANGQIVRERIAIYDVAMADNLQNALAFLTIARLYRSDARQDSVYIRGASGAVAFVTLQDDPPEVQ